MNKETFGKVAVLLGGTSNEREISVVQEVSEDPDYAFKVGDEVRVVRSSGKSRVVPYN